MGDTHRKRAERKSSVLKVPKRGTEKEPAFQLIVGKKESRQVCSCGNGKRKKRRGGGKSVFLIFIRKKRTLLFCQGKRAHSIFTKTGENKKKGKKGSF